MDKTFSITIQGSKRIILFVLFCSLALSCKEKVNNKNPIVNEDVTKDERLVLFLESPITINTSPNEQRLNSIKFHKSYILNDNPHFNSDSDSIAKASSNSYVILNGSTFDKEQDSLIRLASTKDVIEILKNKYVERITYMRLNSDGIQLNYGVYLGMDLDSFTKLLPLKIDENLVASYADNDAVEATFTFDEDSKRLKEFNYLSIIE